MPIRFAKGPASDGSIGFNFKRSVGINSVLEVVIAEQYYNGLRYVITKSNTNVLIQKVFNGNDLIWSYTINSS
jgi:hypothetical protein